ncbi:PilW family protein [Methylomonas rapida]|uniref:Prepilin-type N-terminal cleavage/methylation domain-containing protein n=1 Tax=Methylomonas rapida TaxID=2963939 RepID=A0ABY7GPY2_9GAMM|nr:prepilin-type N-terminal cleavage/methylation domain-containing protein [Methylomonas rapida]WAR46541.1 prepilin-type N-terminal cleavage/methylation domain-containing protein [Methylomonas rapida]
MKKQTGFTLIEIMIALLLGLIVVGATISIYIATVGSSASTIRSSRLNHDLESVMTLMANDIRRAGYWEGAADNEDDNNPFTNTDATAGAVTNVNILENGTCILYSYDADNPSPITIVNNEFYGFKLQNNTIMMRLSGSSTTNCNDANDTWQNFIDNNQLTITALQFSFAPIDVNGDGDTTDPGDLPATSRCWNQTQKTSTNQLACTGGANGDYIIQNRIVNIRLSGRVSADQAVTKTLLGTTEIRNNRICVWDGANCP